MRKIKLAKKLISILLFVSFIFCIYTENCKLVGNAETKNNQNEEVISLDDIKPGEKIYSKATIKDDFLGDSVLVVLDESFSNRAGISTNQINKIFSEIDYKSIEDLTCQFNTSTEKLTTRENDYFTKFYQTHTFRQILKITLKTNTKKRVLSVIDMLKNNKEIMYIGPDYIDRIDKENDYPSNDEFEIYDDSSNDSKLDKQWGLKSGYGINAIQGWNITSGNNSVRVGIIDTGISNHEDLIGNLTTGYDFYNNNTITTDDEDGHGTHVAGIVGAVGNNDIGGSGVAQTVKLVPLQASHWDEQEQDFLFSSSQRIQAINYATSLWDTDERISILNHSIGSYGESIALLESINNFPGLFVWSAGNGNRNVDTLSNINRFRLNNLISVGEIKENGEKSSFSNYGENVDIFAPGSHILSTVPDNKYAYYNGTSMAAPFVSGCAALLLSYDMSLTGAELKNAIIKGTPHSINAANTEYSVKRLNILSSLAALDYNLDYLELSVNEEKSSEEHWYITIKNPNNTIVTVTYNESMCFSTDARDFTNLNHLRSFKLSPNGIKNVKINEYGTAGYVAVCMEVPLSCGYVVRQITYAHNISKNGLSCLYNATIGNGVLSADLVPNYLDIQVVNREGAAPYGWDIKLKNTNSVQISVVYNEKMCFQDDAKYFRNLKHLSEISIPANSEKTVHISGYGTAGYITMAINYSLSGILYRRVTYANNLSRNTDSNGNYKYSANVYENEIVVIPNSPSVPSVPSYLELKPIKKIGLISPSWDIEIKNNNSFSVQVSYNSKLCFSSEAESFEGLNDLVTIEIPANSSKTVRISGNGTAGYATTSINYSFNGYEYKRITYAHYLKVNSATCINCEIKYV